MKSLADAAELLTATFDEAVRLRMRSDAPFGVYLSGGINSSAVVAAMTVIRGNLFGRFRWALQRLSIPSLRMRALFLNCTALIITSLK